MAFPAAAFEPALLSVEAQAATGASESYLAFLVRKGLIYPLKARNRRTNLFPLSEIERIRWAVENRGRLTLAEMRRHLESGHVSSTNLSTSSAEGSR